VSDDALNRRDFLFGRFLRTDVESPKKSDESDEGGEEDGQDFGWKPDWQPATEQELEENRRAARQQLGELQQPDDRPFDALEFIAGLDGGTIDD
jgi:hypothetical protein